MMKSVFIIFITLMVVVHAKDIEWGNLSCTISLPCQLQVQVYKTCRKMTGLDRAAGGPCITCPDLSRCCCTKDRDLVTDETCRISQGCQWELENCQAEDRAHLAESSLGCADGSRCWCFKEY